MIGKAGWPHIRSKEECRQVNWLSRRDLLAVFFILGLGFLFTLANVRLPILRNSLVYAQIAKNLLKHNMKLWDVCSTPQLAYNKACAFPAVSAPLVWMFGANAGLKWATFLTTSALLLATLWFFRRFNHRFQLQDDLIWIEISIVFFNPLMIYQFWSGYSDSLFAALFLLSFILLDIVLNGPKSNAAGWSIAYALVLVLAVMTKHHGLALFLLHPVYIYWHRDLVLNRFAARDPNLLWTALAACVAIGFVGLGIIGNNAFLNIRPSYASAQYSRPIFYPENVKEFVIFLMLTFGILLLAAVGQLRISRTDVEFALLAILYTHAIMVHQDARENMRWYIPVMPFMALYIARALKSLRPRRLTSIAFSLFLPTNLLSILVFNHAGDSNSVFLQQLRRLPINIERQLDNLRMNNHRAIASSFETINRSLPPNSTLYWLSNYYGDASYHIFQDSHLLRSDIQIVYLPEFDNIHPVQREFFVFQYELYSVRPNVPLLETTFKHATVTQLDNDLFRIQLPNPA